MRGMQAWNGLGGSGWTPNAEGQRSIIVSCKTKESGVLVSKIIGQALAIKNVSSTTY